MIRLIMLMFLLTVFLLTVISNGLAWKEEIDKDLSSSSTFSLRMKYKNNTEVFTNIKIEDETLANFNMTKREVKSSWLQEDANGAIDLITPTGRRIVVQEETIKVPTIKHVTMTISIDQNINLTMKDIIGDPDLVPVNPEPLLFTKSSKCLLKSFYIKVDYDITIKMNNEEKNVGSEPKTDFEGLFLASINPGTCSVVYRKTFRTNEFGTYRNLMTTLDGLADNRVIIIASQFEGSLMLAEDARAKIAGAGSFLVDHYSYGDNWVFVYVNGGPTLADVMVPNMGYNKNENFTGAPINLYLNIHNILKKSPSKMCPEWPADELWNLRRILCETNDALSNFCNCLNPTIFKTSSKDIQMPIIIVSGGRLHSLNRLLESLADQPSIVKESFIIVLDGENTSVRQLAFIHDIKLVLHGPEGFGPIRVSRNLRFGLFNALQLFPMASSFIVLEDDLILSPDFYSYMNQLFPIFAMDDSIYGVSGFNYFSFPHSSHDPTLTYRNNWLPSYGWMMPRKVIEEVLPKWPNKYLFHDWDHFFNSEIIRKGREAIVPDISRVFHDCNQNHGVHLGPSWFSERNFLRQKLSNLTSTTLMSLKRLTKTAYAEEMDLLASTATPFEVYDAYNIIFPKVKHSIFVIYVKKNSSHDISSLQVLADGLGVWSGDPSHHEYNHACRISYNNSTLLLVGVPISPYSRYRAPNYQVFSASPKSAKRVLDVEFHKNKVPIKYSSKTDLEKIFS